MKKILSIMLAIIVGIGATMARDMTTRDINVLPANARQFISTHFGKKKVSHIKVDGRFDKEYDVILTDGSEIEFNNSGDWKEIDCGYNSVPRSILLKSIVDHVKSNYKGRKIVGVEKKRNAYEITLDNDTELVFDRAGNFKRIDN